MYGLPENIVKHTNQMNKSKIQKDIFKNLADNLTKYINKDFSISDKPLSTSKKYTQENTSYSPDGFHWEQEQDAIKNSYSEQ